MQRWIACAILGGERSVEDWLSESAGDEDIDEELAQETVRAEGTGEQDTGEQDTGAEGEAVQRIGMGGGKRPMLPTPAA